MKGRPIGQASRHHPPKGIGRKLWCALGGILRCHNVDSWGSRIVRFRLGEAKLMNGWLRTLVFLTSLGEATVVSGTSHAGMTI